KLRPSAKSGFDESATSLEKKIQILVDGPEEKAKGQAPSPNLTRSNGDVATLYGVVGQSDASPTAAQGSAASSAERDLKTLLTQWDELKQSDLPAFNRRLKEESLPELQLQTDMHIEESRRGDEE